MPTVVTPTVDVFVVEDFLRGRVPRILRASKHPKVLLTWLHTDEELAPRVAHYIYTQRPDLAEHVDFLCGNPEVAATESEKGFKESDLNRSFRTKEVTTHEQKRAVEILRFIESSDYDYLFDLHTFVTSIGHSFIVAGSSTIDESTTQRMIAASPLDHILVFPESIMRHTLVGSTSVPAIAMECAKEVSHVQGLQDAVRTLENLIGSTSTTKPRERELFYVDGTVPKTEDLGPEARNFELYRGKYYPLILSSGPRSYREDPTKNYQCFRATRRDVRVL